MMQFYSIQSSLQQMKFSAKKYETEKKKAKEPLSHMEKEMERMREDAKRVREGNLLSSIDAKLMSGSNLSDDELEYLKKNNPEAYKEAVEVMNERKNYKEALKKCRSKEDVEKLHQNKLQSFAANIKSIDQNPNIPKLEKLKKMETIFKKLMAVEDEHMTFKNSSRYQKLPDSLDDKNKKDGIPKPDDDFVENLVATIEASIKDNEDSPSLDILDSYSSGVSTVSSSSEYAPPISKVTSDGISINIKV